jgi:hypothetical protein
MNLPTSVSAGNSFTGTVGFGSAVTADTTVSLSSSGSCVSVPASAVVLQGSSQATYTGQAVSPCSSVTLTGSYSGGTGSVLMSVTP